MDYCGCCGRECTGEWCLDCIGHLLPRDGNIYPHERTYFAQFKKPCPFEGKE